MPRPLPPAKRIDHLFFYKIFLCLVYSDDTWKIYYTPDEEFGGWVGFEGGRDKAKNVADEICKNRDAFVRSRAILKPLIVLVIGAKTHCQLPIANYPSCKNPPGGMSEGFLFWGADRARDLLIFCCFQNFPKLGHSIFG